MAKKYPNAYAFDREKMKPETLRKFYTKAWRLTPYAFACGYEERRDLSDGNESRLYKEGVYHVRTWSRDGVRGLWMSFERLSDARKAFDAMR